MRRKSGLWGRLYVVALVIAASLTLPPAGAAAAPADPYVFEGTPDEQFNGWGMWYGDGISVPRQLVADTNRARPALSPDGQTVAYHDGACLKLVGVAVGSVPVTVTCPGSLSSGPSWHPDGQRLIFAREFTGDSTVEVTDLAGNTETLINWPSSSAYRRPNYSPDGSKIAVSAWLTPEGVPNGGSRVYVTNADGTSPIDISGVDGGLYPSWSPNGDKVAYIGYPSSSDGGEIALAAADGSGVSYVTMDDGIDQAGVNWSLSAGFLYTDAPPGPDDTAGWLTHQVNALTGSSSRVLEEWHWVEGLGFSQPVNAGPPTDPYEALLLRYVPELRYDSQETFFADSAATATDYAGTPSTGYYGNTLNQESGSKIAGHAPGDLPLSLGFLSATYPNQMTAISTDYVDETQSGDGYGLASDQIRSSNPGVYANKVYGRVVQQGAFLWLQYWLFYYYNPFAIATRGTHEGDWELVMVRLNSVSHAPEEVVYSQHSNGESCPWPDAPKAAYGSDLVPVVYVGRGSHANYPSTIAGGNPLQDSTDGARGPLRPDLLSITAPPSWISWPGRWGSTRANTPVLPIIGPTAADSPKGPAFQGDRWDNPMLYADDADECTVSGGASSTSQAGSAAPPAPQIEATSSGDEAVVRYDIPAATDLPAARYLLVTVEGTNRERLPMGGMETLIPGETVRRVPLPRGGGPYVVRASTLSTAGARSAVVSRTLSSGG